jgi:rod shape-determining protein MreC
MLVTSWRDGRVPRGYPVAGGLRVESDGSDQFARIPATPLAHLDRSLEVLLVWRQDDKPPAGKSAAAPTHTADLDLSQRTGRSSSGNWC